MRQQRKWFPRFADVPGVGYEGDLERRSRLPASNAVPIEDRLVLAGRRMATLSWRTDEGSTSASPAHQLAFGSWTDETSEAIRERVLNALELPGELSDYHFAIQGAAEALWKRRREEPTLIALVEWLCWCDVRLIEAHPSVIEIEPGKAQYYRVHAFERIVGLYQREGFLHEALAAAERFARFEPTDDVVTELRERVRQLGDEHE